MTAVLVWKNLLIVDIITLILIWTSQVYIGFKNRNTFIVNATKRSITSIISTTIIYIRESMHVYVVTSYYLVPFQTGPLSFPNQIAQHQDSQHQKMLLHLRLQNDQKDVRKCLSFHIDLFLPCILSGYDIKFIVLYTDN